MSQEPSLSHLQLELDKLKACIHCGMCLPACPTYRATGSEAESPRGRLYLMKKMLEGALPEEQVRPHLDQCLACHGCETVCPSGVEYGRILLATREDLSQSNRSPRRMLKRFLFRRVLPNHAVLRVGGAMLRLYQQSGLQKMVRQTGLLNLVPSLAAQEKLLPAIPAHRALLPSALSTRALSGGLVFGDPAGEPVALLVGCVMDIFYNPVHWDTIEVLTANGYAVSVPPQTCCGALAHHAGEADITRQLAKQNIDLFLKPAFPQSARDNAQEKLSAHPAPMSRWIVVNSAGCGSSMKEYPHLLADDPVYAEPAQRFADKVIDIMALLAQKPLAPFKRGLLEKMTYHAACHLYHVQKVKTQPLDVLRQIPGLELVPLTDAEACCGSAGIYNIEHPELSAEILSPKMQHIRTACEQHGVTTVVTGNPGCLLQLEKGAEEAALPIRVRHPISVLAEAYRS